LQGFLLLLDLMEKITGIGGVFLKYTDVDKAKEWYKTYLGIDIGKYGYTYSWRKIEKPEEIAHTVFSLFKKEVSEAKPSTSAMINFRVSNLNALLSQLKKQGIDQLGETEEYEYGKFAWILDLEGNKIELWEPIDDKLV